MSTTVHSRRPLAIAAAAAFAVLTILALATARPAAALPEYKVAKFKVSLKGTQEVKTANHQDAEFPCDVRDYSTSGETTKFKTKKPLVFTVSQRGKAEPTFSAAKTGFSFPVTATINRYNNPDITTSGDPSCGDNGGGVVGGGPKSDCGIKKAPWDLAFEYDYYRKDILTITDYSGGDDPFDYCGGGAEMFPFLSDTDGRANPLGGELPAEELFDPKIGKLILLAKGRKADDTSISTSIIDVRWELTLKRMKTAD